MEKPPRIGATSFTLLLILLVYLALVALFAFKTPPWQNPDEPAHYNYVAYLATEGKLPVLQMGDYDGAYLERLKAEKFPPALSIDPVRYEFHQPPLYYLLAAPVYWLSGGSLLALRLFSAVLGAGVVLLIFLCARTVLPGSPHIALGAAAFTAFLPMHIAVMASVNNDALAELIVAAAMLALLRWQTTFSNEDPADGSLGSARRLLLATGLLIGVGFLTKATAYILLPIALIVVAAGIVWRTQARPLTARAQFTQYALLIAPALLLGLPWWIRNSLLYGNGDFLGLAWHDVVVTGQPTAAAWIADNGWSAYWVRAWTFTSKSFWGVFGWLGVFMDARIYTALFLLSLMAAVGALLRCRRWAKGDKKRWLQFPSSPWMALLLLWLGAFAAYAWYNVGFIQHQGRYLFPALPTWSLLAAVGWWAVLEKRSGIAAAAILLAGAAIHVLAGMTTGGVDRWTLLLYGAAAIGLLLYTLLSPQINRVLTGIGGARWASHEPLRPILYLCLFLALIALDIAIPFLYIVPQLHA